MNTDKKFLIKRSFLDGINRELIISDTFLKFQNKDLKKNPFTIFEKEEIAEYKYGIRWISFRITYGRDYQIFFRNKKGEILKINFKSYFGKNKKEYHQKYIDILNVLWNNFFDEIAQDFLKKFKNNESFKIGNIEFDEVGITIAISGIAKTKKTKISWENVRTKNYYTYFAIYSSQNPSEINRGYNYHDDWNTGVLYSVLRTILKSKNIETY